jgi:hypothetical protein
MGAVMSFSIDPVRRSPGARRSKPSAADLAREAEAAAPAESANLPIPVGRAQTVSPKGSVASAAHIEAQKIGERRGLKAGAAAIDQAKVSYNRTEWSGSRDRRAPKGRAAKTEI